MLEIFKTNVTDTSQAASVITLLNQHFPQCQVNFDLHDCDKILRIKGESFAIDKIIELVASCSFHCNLLD